MAWTVPSSSSRCLSFWESQAERNIDRQMDKDRQLDGLRVEGWMVRESWMDGWMNRKLTGTTEMKNITELRNTRTSERKGK